MISNVLRDPHYIRISEDDPLPDISDLRPFKALVIIEDSPSAEWQISVSEWLIGQGCLYIMAWGEDCSIWNECVEHAKSVYFDCRNVPDTDPIIATWHDGWAPAEAFHYAKFVSKHPTINVSNTIFIHLGSIDKGSNFIADFMAIDRF